MIKLTEDQVAYVQAILQYWENQDYETNDPYSSYRPNLKDKRFGRYMLCSVSDDLEFSVSYRDTVEETTTRLVESLTDGGDWRSVGIYDLLDRKLYIQEVTVTLKEVVGEDVRNPPMMVRLGHLRNRIVELELEIKNLREEKYKDKG